MKIEQDGFYLNAKGDILYVWSLDGINYYDGNNNCYNDNGLRYKYGQSGYDLIGYIPKELHYHLINTIKSYHTIESFKTFIDGKFNKWN